jgi:hypothetical protein
MGIIHFFKNLYTKQKNKNKSLKDWNSNEDISCFEFLNSLSLDENKYVKFY